MRPAPVVAGAELAQRRRAAAAPRRSGECASRIIASRDLARGPARLATALGVELADSGGMLAAGSPPPEGFALQFGTPAPPERIAAGPRVGVSGPGGGPEYPWRFWLEGDSTVSTYRAAVRRGGATRAR